MIFKMADKSEYNGTFSYINEKDIEMFESKYNIRLPNDYKEFMLIHNGGRVSQDIQFLIDNETFQEISYIYLMELESIIDWIDSVIDNEYDDIGNDLINRKIICIGDDWHGFTIGINTLNGNIGIIDYGLILDTSFFVIANTFTDFINGFQYITD